MASAVDICNLALSHLGDRATVSSIDPPEGSAQAEHCARFYPIARDALLEMHEWSFAMRRVTLALDGGEPSSWEYSYALPSGCISVRKIFPAEAQSDEDDGVDFKVENGSIFTNTETASAWYIARVTDTTRFSPLFTTALSYLLSRYLVGPVLKGDAQALARVSADFAREFVMATASNGRTKRSKPTHTTWMAQR